MTTLHPVLETLHEAMSLPSLRHGADIAFDPATSPWYGKPIFIVGVPRSGTTWLHQMLSVHPDVVTAGEAHVFCEGVSALLKNHDDPDPNMMLSTWVSRRELLALVRQLIDGIFTTMQAGNRPDATRVLDKTPNHVRYAADLAEVYPDASFVHIIRDPRDAVSSQRDLWGAWDADSRIWATAAANWRLGVEDNRRHLRHLRYHEVRYEDLVRDPVARMTDVFTAVGLDHDPHFVTEVVDFCRAPINVRPSDERVGVRKWSDMDPIGEREVVTVLGDLMVEMGYLTEAERTEILARRSWHDLSHGASAAARHLASAARSHIRAAGGKARRHAVTSGDQRALGERFGSALVAGDAAALTALLAPGTTMSAEDLAELGRGGRIATIQADALAVSIHLVTGHGTHRHIRCFSSNAQRVDRIVVQGGPAPSAR